MISKYGLGKGLSSLIPQKKKVENSENISNKYTKTNNISNTNEEDKIKKQKGLKVIGADVSKIKPNKQQPRMYFEEESLRELANSIKEHGILQPLIVIKSGECYELIAGERRLRASKIAGLKKVPVIVREGIEEQKKLEFAIIENVQRHDLNIIEEAKAYKKLATEFNLSQDEIANKTGKSRSVVANRIRLTQLPIEIQRAIIDKQISEGHAKVILSLQNIEKQRVLFNTIISGKLSVRDSEKVLKNVGYSNNTTESKVVNFHKISLRERNLEEDLTAHFGTRVKIKTKNNGGGNINISFYSNDELNEILKKLNF